jgi:hypothetical protein
MMLRAIHASALRVPFVVLELVSSSWANATCPRAEGCAARVGGAVPGRCCCGLAAVPVLVGH